MRRLVILLTCLLAGSGHAKTVTTVIPAQSYELRRQSAIALTSSDTGTAEKQLLKLLEENRADPHVLFALGRISSDRAHLLKPGSQRQKALKEARKYFVRAKEAGSTEPMVTTVLAEINPDGSENRVVFSANEQLNAKIHEAERAYEQRDFPKAITLYQQALAIDPRHYAATLYVGDAYFASGQNEPAITWFNKAAELDPSRETAFRYCGDALLRMGKKEQAMEQYLQAVIAEPYNAYTRRALQNYCQVSLLKPWVHAEQVPYAEVKPGKDGKPEISLPENFTILHMAYATARAKWQLDNHENIKASGQPYRQTIAEEVAALRTLLTVFAELKSSPQTPPKELTTVLEKLGPTMAQLKEIETADLLEAHVFLFRANQDIAADYENFRNTNRDLLRTYLVKFYLHLP